MWKKRACSVLLAFMVAMTAIPFSAVPVFSQEAGTVQEVAEAEGTAESVKTEAVNASVPDEKTEGEEEALTQEPVQAEKDADTEDVSDASDPQSQEEEKLQEEAVLPGKKCEVTSYYPVHSWMLSNAFRNVCKNAQNLA